MMDDHTKRRAMRVANGTANKMSYTELEILSIFFYPWTLYDKYASKEFEIDTFPFESL